jgi:hypothetical protein
MQPDRNTWKLLLHRAVDVLRAAEQRMGALPELMPGDGTVLMLRFQHRLSKDIDLFLHDVQWLSMFTPRLASLKNRIDVLDLSDGERLRKLILPLPDHEHRVATMRQKALEAITRASLTA